MKSYEYIIGIDPGVKTGFSVYNVGGKIIEEAFTTTFWGAIQGLENFTDKIARSVVLVVVELPKNKSIWHNGATTKGAIGRTGVNVGSVIREAELLIDGIRRMGFDVQTPHPTGKVSAERIRALTGWKERTNSHVRDAILLCWRGK